MKHGVRIEGAKKLSVHPVHKKKEPNGSSEISALNSQAADSCLATYVLRINLTSAVDF